MTQGLPVTLAAGHGATHGATGAERTNRSGLGTRPNVHASPEGGTHTSRGPSLQRASEARKPAPVAAAPVAAVRDRQ